MKLNVKLVYTFFGYPKSKRTERKIFVLHYDDLNFEDSF